MQIGSMTLQPPRGVSARDARNVFTGLCKKQRKKRVTDRHSKGFDEMVGRVFLGDSFSIEFFDGANITLCIRAQELPASLKSP